MSHNYSVLWTGSTSKNILLLDRFESHEYNNSLSNLQCPTTTRYLKRSQVLRMWYYSTRLKVKSKLSITESASVDKHSQSWGLVISNSPQNLNLRKGEFMELVWKTQHLVQPSSVWTPIALPSIAREARTHMLSHLQCPTATQHFARIQVPKVRLNFSDIELQSGEGNRNYSTYNDPQLLSTLRGFKPQKPSAT